MGTASEEKQDLSRIVRGARLSMPGTLIGNAMSLLLDMCINRYLSLADYGLYGAFRRMILWLGLLGQVGVENDLLRRISTGQGAAALKSAWIGSVGASAAIGAVMWAGAGWFGRWMGGGEALFLWFALAMPLAAIRLCAVTASQGWMDLRPRVLVLMLMWPVVQLAILIPMLGRLGLLSVAIAWCGSMALGAVVAVWLLLRQRPDLSTELWEAPRERLSDLLRRTWPMWAQALLAGAYGYLDQILLPGLRSPEEAGIYGPVAILAPLLGLPLASLNGIFAPIIAARHAAGDIEGLQTRYRFVIRLALLGMLPALAPMLVMPEAVLEIWPSGTAAAAPAMRIAAAGWVIATVAGSVNYLLLMSGHTRDPLKNGLLATATSLLLSLILLPRFGATGAALANSAALIAANLMGGWQVWRRLGLHPFDAGLWKVAGIGAAALGAVWGVGQAGLPPVVGVVAGGAVAAAVAAGGWRIVGK